MNFGLNTLQIEDDPKKLDALYKLDAIKETVTVLFAKGKTEKLSIF